MSKELKNISEIAREIGKSRQAIYQKIKENSELSSYLSSVSVKKKNSVLYTVDGQNAIKQAFERGEKSENVKCQVSSVNQNDTLQVDTLLDTLQSQIIDLKADKQKLQEQFETILTESKKEYSQQIEFLKSQICNLQSDKEQLYKQLETERMEKQTILAKYLVMNEEQEEQQEEVKATVVEPEPVKAEQEPTEQEEQPQQKQGFFARLFRRKSR